MLRPFGVDLDYLQSHLDEMVDVTFSDLERVMHLRRSGTADGA
jgi:hypothetical protein